MIWLPENGTRVCWFHNWSRLGSSIKESLACSVFLFFKLLILLKKYSYQISFCSIHNYKKYRVEMELTLNYWLQRKFVLISKYNPSLTSINKSAGWTVEDYTSQQLHWTESDCETTFFMTQMISMSPKFSINNNWTIWLPVLPQTKTKFPDMCPNPAKLNIA